jgi:hypothetical protein
MIAFTLCSNNYLAQAKTLADSFARTNPNGHFVVGLVDRPRVDVDYSVLGASEIVPVEDLRIPEFEGFWRRYSVLELNTAVKPYYFEYLLSGWQDETICYLDPDIEVYSALDPVRDELAEDAVLLTPHALSPLPDDGLGILESAFLRCGVYNLGFLAMSCAHGSAGFLDWWKARTARWGFVRAREGLFVDQLWMNLAPVYFDGFRVSCNPGLNMAYWNLHERRLSREMDGAFSTNGTHPLVFFHFSALDPVHPDSIATSQNRFSLANRPDVEPLFREYSHRLLANGYGRFRGLDCYFAARRDAYLREGRRRSRQSALKEAPMRYAMEVASAGSSKVARAVGKRMGVGARPDGLASGKASK